MSSTIAEVYGRQILDSRGNPTVEAQITLACGITSTASVPSGASTGVHEAVELRDKNPQLYGGKSVLLAVEHINTCIAREIINLDVLNQTKIDQTLIQLDATECKSRLGANAILAVSIAAARAAAEYLDIPLFRYLGGCCANRLPIPMMNLINGGCHADNKLDIQEFMIVPWGFATFSEALKAGSETYHILKKLLCEKNLFTGLGDEGGFAPCFSNNSSQKDDNNNSVQIKSGTPAEQVFDLLINAIDQAGYKPQTCRNINTENRTGQISLAIDAAASEFYDPQTKRYRLNGQNLDVSQLVDVYES